MDDLRLNFLQLVIFDLDGTLVDSVPDIAVALNAALCDLALPDVTVEQVRRWVGNGARMLARRALARGVVNDVAPERVDDLYAQFLRRYAERVCEQSRIYPGVEECLAGLHARGCWLACVTNKPHALAAALLETLQLEHWFACLLGGDSLPEKKPDPTPLRHVMQQLQAAPENTLMVGDSAADVRAARAAGVQSVCVSYGYNQGQDVRTLGADLVLDTLAHLPGAFAALAKDRAAR